MKKYWILLTAAILVILGLIIQYVDPSSILAQNYFSAGDYACGVFAVGNFSFGIFSVGIFSFGIFSIGIFNIGIYAIGIFVFALRKKCLHTEPKKCDC